MIDKGMITVLDDFMGKGKTSFAIQFINRHRRDLSYVYCTPFLDEVERIRQCCPDANFLAPTYASGRKIDDFNLLLMEGANIVVTHSTFTNATDETIEYLRDSNYVLIMDETLSTLENFNDVCTDMTQRVNRKDIQMLRDKGIIQVDDYGYVSWVGESYMGGKYSDVERLAKNGTLLFLDDSMLVWQFPAYIFALFRKVLILTYCFDGSILKPYFQYHGLQYEKKSVEYVDGRYELTDYRVDYETLAKYRGLITVYDNKKANDYKNHALSKSWYNRRSKTELDELQRNLRNFFLNTMKAKSKDILWTCPKDYYDYLKSKGFISLRRLTPEERKLPKQDQERLERELSCFLPCNSRATNMYRERSVLAYCINMFMNPYVKKYFEKKNIKDGTSIEVNEELFALQMMLQWIFRSRIRDMQPITIYIPSSRMRNMLLSWLQEGEISHVTAA